MRMQFFLISNVFMVEKNSSKLFTSFKMTMRKKGVRDEPSIIVREVRHNREKKRKWS